MKLDQHVTAADRAMDGVTIAIFNYKLAILHGRNSEQARQSAHDHLDAFLDNVAMIQKAVSG